MIGHTCLGRIGLWCGGSKPKHVSNPGFYHNKAKPPLHVWLIFVGVTSSLGSNININNLLIRVGLTTSLGSVARSPSVKCKIFNLLLFLVFFLVDGSPVDAREACCGPCVGGAPHAPFTQPWSTRPDTLACGG